MVATRRGARTNVDETTSEVDSTLSLRKKPTRKAAVKPATSAPTNKEPAKPRTTRARKAGNVDPDREDTIGEEAQESVVEAPKTRQTTTRAKKTEASAASVPVKNRPASKTVTKPTRATTARSRKADVLKDQVQELPSGPKTRATRSTRTIIATEKASILSPKKVTQVTRGPLRETKSSAAKVSTKSGPAKPTASARTTRRRGVSDENAEVQLSRVAEEDKGDPVKQTKQKSPSRTPRELVIEIDSDSEMSSRPTTPTNSPRSKSNLAEKELDEVQHISGSKHTDSDSDSDNDDVDGSEDELCGPKTPMRRCSPREAARFSTSPIRSPQHIQSPTHIQTPTRRQRLAFNGTRVPQTQRHPAKASFQSLDRESMTIARAADRAMVFPELKALPLDLKMPMGEPSKIPSDSNKQSELSLLEQDTDHSATSDSLLESTNTLHQDTNGEDVVFDVNDVPAVDLDFTMEDNVTGNVVVDSPAGLHAPVSAETIGYGVEVFDDDDSVIIASNQRALEQVSPVKSFGMSVMGAPTPKPETLIWENIRLDETFAFDAPLGNETPDSLPEPDQTEILSPAASFASGDQIEHTTSGADNLLFQMPIACNEPQNVDRRLTTGVASARPSLDATVHLSQFIDVQSPSEHGIDNEPGYPIDLEMDADFDISAADVMQSTPTKVSVPVKECPPPTVDMAVPEAPRYAQQTMSSAVKRRQSLPAISFTTPTKTGWRPHTSDGTTLPESLVGQLFQVEHGVAVESDRRSALAVTPLVSSSAEATRRHESIDPTPIMRTPQITIARPTTPSASTPRRRIAKDSLPAPRTIAGERYCDRQLPASRKSFQAPSREETPAASTVKATRTQTQERYPGLPSRTTYEELVETPTARETPRPAAKTPDTVRANRPIISAHRKSTNKRVCTPIAGTPIAQKPTSPITATPERYPGLPSRRNYEEHAQTAVVPTRFRTVSHVPAKRPASAMKASSLRDLHRRDTGSIPGTPIKTPLKPPGMTPGPVAMTPHPSAPLRGVYALVDVWTNDAAPASSAFAALLQRLGARTSKSWSARLTHVVFKSGSPGTLERLRRHNRAVTEANGARGDAGMVLCVNSRWVTDCDAEGRRVDERDDAYAVDIDEACRGSKRRRKSMEPAALVNVGGRVVRDRKSSLGRASIGRSSVKQPLVPGVASPEEKENVGRDLSSSPATPAYLAAPSSLVQQTAPLNKVRKLALGPAMRAKDRRTTVWQLEF